ncbi:MAG: PP2C family protein-serine/threonine phosphatase [Gammaproteobacteria bacterium]|nr:PP2C family protein-serine/threonine phosphatase [Gammaproteobacteria bacterium]
MDITKNFLIIFASIVTLMVVSLVLYTEVLENEAKIHESAEKRYQSYLLADELRQSSDDLTRMARTYTVTGDDKYKNYFDQILAIRGGEAPRPADYHNIYWDFIAATGLPPRINTQAIALKDLMKQEEFTETEFALLRETENESNELVNLENRAMNAMVGLFEDGTGRYTQGRPDRELARNLLHGDEYHQAKEKIMMPLEDFFEAIDHRTSGEVAVYRDKQRRVNLVLMLTLGLSALLASISLVLGWASLKKKGTDSGKSRLAQRLAASGYPSPGAGGKGSPRDMLAGRQSASVAATEKAGQETTAETSSLVFFLRNFWNSWPLFVAAVVITFMTLALSWWFLSENKIQSYAKVRDELKFTLDATHSAVNDWLNQISQDTSKFAEAVGRQVSNETLQLIKEQPEHMLHGEFAASIITGTEVLESFALEEGLRKFGADTNIANPDLFENYMIIDRKGIVLSSNRADLIGKYFAYPEGFMERMSTRKTVINFPDRHAKDELLSQNIVFGSLIDGNKGAVLIMASPRRILAKILRRGYSGNYGEIYMVDAEGRFVSEPRWKEEMYDEGWVGADVPSVVGMSVSQHGKAAGTANLPLSVRSVVAGEAGGELDEYENYLGDEVVGYWSWDNTYGFGIINEFKSRDAFATFRAYSNQALAGSGITAGLILALTLMSIWSRTNVARANEKMKAAFKTIKSHNDKLAQDLRIGQKVQMDMLPDPIKGEGFNLEAFLKPAQSVSGDFYDFSMLQDDKVYFCVGDVSGKGIPASLFMSVTKALLTKILDQTDQTKDIVTRVNRELSLNNDSNMFVTLVLGIVDLKTGRLLITNGGHNLPFIKKSTGELICLEQIQGPLVGTFEGIEFEQQSIEMEKGDMVLFYTDGVTEAQNIRDEFYEDDRLEELLDKNEFEAAEDLTNAVFRSVVRFIGRADQFDDITILSFQYTGL